MEIAIIVVSTAGREARSPNMRKGDIEMLRRLRLRRHDERKGCALP